MRIVWLLGLTTGCGYISDAKYDLRLDPDQDGVSIEEDCDNNDPNLGLKRTFYADVDGDGFGNPDEVIEACTMPDAASENALDCDDTRADVNPGMEDVFYDGVDADCDGSNDCDKDGDGFDGSADGGLPTEECPNATDCNDEDPEVKPVDGATEVFFNGEDDDCNLNTGDGDSDGDGFWHVDYEAIVQANGRTPLSIPEGQGGDCYDSVAEPVEGFEPEIIGGGVVSPADVHPSATEAYYDGVDQNCDGLSDFDQDGDGFFTADHPDRDGMYGTDCVDFGEVYGVLAVDINPDAGDTWYDGVDQDCSGNNDFDQDVDGETINGLDCEGDGSIDTECDFDGDGNIDFTAGIDCDDTNASINPSSEEIEIDGVDQNCDGLEKCYQDQDLDGFGSDFLVDSTDFTCSTSGFSLTFSDCDDNDASSYPNAIEYCDGADNACSGAVPLDEQDLDGDNHVECTIVGPTWGSIVGGDDCEPNDGTVYQNAPELIDGIDNDCDGQLVSDEEDLDGDGYITGAYNPSVWVGDSLVVGGDDCNDSEMFQYPGAAYIDSATACLVDADGDGFAPEECFFFSLEFSDSSGFGWDNASVQLVVDGNLHGFYGVNGGNTTESDNVCGVNLEWIINYSAPSISAASLTIYDVNGVEIGSGSGSAQGQTWDWGHSSSMSLTSYTSGQVFQTTEHIPGYGSDCDDTDNTRFPNAPELCDGVPNECGVSLPADEADNDNDGYVECDIDVNGWFGSSSVMDGLDCDDNNPFVNPGQSEIPDDGLDNDCDGGQAVTDGGGTGISGAGK